MQRKAEIVEKQTRTEESLCLIVFLLSSLSGSAALSKELSLHSIFQTNMILQRDNPIAVWGSAAPGDESFAGKM